VEGDGAKDSSSWDRSTGAKAPVERDGAKDSSSWVRSTGAKRQWRVMEPKIFQSEEYFYLEIIQQSNQVRLSFLTHLLLII
jgi:hypothetical protein